MGKKWLALGILIVAVLATVIILNFRVSKGAIIDYMVDIDNGDLSINWNKYQSYDVSLESTYTITKSGIYHLTGELNDGSVIVRVKDGIVKLVLDNVTIKNPYGPAIACYEGDDLVIELIGENTLVDGESYSADIDEDAKGVVYSKADLTFNGNGSLKVVGNYQDGIISKDDLKFNGGTYNITAKDDGIRGKDSIYVVSGDFKIDAKGDGMKSTNDTTGGKGFVLIKDGSFDINAESKGIKSINHLFIDGGNIKISSKDDAVHSNYYVSISGGNIEISSGDDGVHADSLIRIEGGNINISQSYEGIEAQWVKIDGGEISIVANDDGINAGGGADASANNRPGAGAFDADTNCAITIDGGKVYVNAAGDGIDSNGYLTFNGGEVIVDGPTNNGNGALDSGAGITFNGGSVIAIGASGMAESLGTSSSAYNVSIYLETAEKANTLIEIKNEAGATIMKHTSSKPFNHISAGTELFKQGGTYTLYLNGKKSTTFTISSIVTTVGNNSNTNPRMRQNQMNRQMPQR